MLMVTGNKGFIGRNLVRRLEAADYEVYGIDRIDGDDVFRKLRNAPWERIRRVYHLGAITDTTETNTEDLMHYNVRFSVELFELAVANSVPVNYASSAAVYGALDGIYNPLNQYAMSKLWVDQHVRDKYTKIDQISGFRFFNVYGKDEIKGARESIVSKFISEASLGAIKVFEGSDKFYRDFICVDDALDLFMRKDMGRGIFDVGTGYPTKVMDIAEKVSELTGAPINVVPFPPYLKDKYQSYTKANISSYRVGLKTVDQWLEENI